MTYTQQDAAKPRKPVILIRQPTEKNPHSCSFKELQRSIFAFGAPGNHFIPAQAGIQRRGPPPSRG